MPPSDALIVGEDWISEHYFTTDSTKESFQGRVLERRKAWDAEEQAGTTRSRFAAARGDIERRLIALADCARSDLGSMIGEDGGSGTSYRPLSDDDRAAVADLDDLLLTVLGYRTGEFTLRDEGPLTWVAPPALPDNPPLVIVRARPTATVDDLIAKHAPTLLAPWAALGEDDPRPLTSVSATLSTLMTDADGPSYALVLAGRWCLVAEKERWPEGRWLAVDLQLVCERNDAKRGGEVDRALTILDAASLAPDASGVTWWRETLEDSIRHTVGVSKDLREGVRLSIEIIANEVLARRAAAGLPELPAEQAQPLAKQALRYLYRILFLLYAEASPELGVLPVGAQEYDAGYGLDRLRDLALTEIHSERARGGTHLYESLDRLFVLVDEGHSPAGAEGLGEGLTFHGLRADLFRPERIGLIAETQLGNEALLKVLRRLLLSKEGKEQRGFISYVELGINQLGAVYEGLMSYTGSFATEDLYEVAKGGDPSKGSWVVPVTRSDHLSPDDFVKVEDERTGAMKPVLHRKGTFVFRLSGRDRQRSASYYTPEVLTRFTVQQALEELLDQDGRVTSAEEILQLTVCEPALGSGAFAIEAVRQLAEEYLSRREKEQGRRVDPEERPAELQKVKAHIALHQVYGVDLNATAVELAEVSLWLDTMVAGLSAPWFGLRLKRGNSLVGARHALYAPDQLAKRAWLTTPPTDVKLSDLAVAVDAGVSLGLDGGIHHFLLPAQGWGSAVEVPKSVKDLVPEATMKRLKTWRAGVRKAPSKAQIKQLQALSMRVEALWGMALRRLRIAEAESSRAIDLWGREAPALSSTVSREQIEDSLSDPDSAYQRLRTIMDAWCALWFWPLTPTQVLDSDGEPVSIEPPTFDQWLDACQMILGTPEKTRPSDAKRGDGTLFSSASWEALNDEETNDRVLAQTFSMAYVHQKHPWLDVCRIIADDQGFFHWELDFATVFARGGFDLQVGNPPWVRPTVDIESLLADTDPWWALALKPSEASKSERRKTTLALGATWRTVVDGSVESAVLATTLASPVLYALLAGQPDLYRAFMSQTWAHASPQGTTGLIHPETHLTDEKATRLRSQTYRRLRRHWEFLNELALFDVHHLVRFGVHTYGSLREPLFMNATALYHPSTVARSLAHDGSGAEPGLKSPDGHWDTAPHRSRVVNVTAATLRLWAGVLDASSPDSTPMLYTVNGTSLRTLNLISNSPRIGSLGLEFSAGWHERSDREAGRLVGAWGRATWSQAVLQGPHVYTSTPLYKIPNPAMRHQTDWTSVDHEDLPATALPVTAYKPAGDHQTYDAAYTHWRLSNGDRVPARDYYRVAWRRMAANTGERTLIPALIPPGAAHVHPITSAGLPERSLCDLVALQAGLSSLLADFSIRSAPKNDIHGTTINRLPMVSMKHGLSSALILRTLRLNCVTEAYADLWAKCWEDGFAEDEAILPRFDVRPIGPAWTPDTPLRRAADRRNAQVEIDVMVAIMLGVPIEDLCTIYRTQFAVLYGYDHREYTYDMNGRLAPYEVLNRWRKQGEPQDPAAMSAQDRTATHPGSGIAYTYIPPFTTYDREADFRQVAEALTTTAHQEAP